MILAEIWLDMISEEMKVSQLNTEEDLHQICTLRWHLEITLTGEELNNGNILQEARKIIRKHDQSKPMFLYLPLQSIHSPHVGNAPRRFRHMYDSSSTSGFESSDKMREALLLSVDYAIHKVNTGSPSISRPTNWE